tara:strand:+ start:999 stop:1955 length:957 start_codon:yes stop_codon:yes gene_type:complete
MFNKSIVAFILSIVLTQVSTAKTQVSTENDHINASSIGQQCYSAKWNKQKLLGLAKQNFIIANELERAELAMQLLHCLAIPQPEIRDGVAFTGLSNWLRGDRLSSEVHRLMFTTLIENFGIETDDKNGVYQPFVALVLSELARVDRKSPYLSSEQRDLLVSKSTAFMSNTNDYRGFDEVVGWRHNVAHTADIFLQLALNPTINKAHLTHMLNAIGEQVLANNAHFYTYGEPERLSTALLYILLKNQHSEQDWQNWLQNYITPTPLKSWQQAYTSQQGLAQLHNARAFLGAVFASIADSNNELLKTLKPALVNAFDNLP